jgi:hypothetical protein
MEDCRADAIGAVNSYLRKVREDKEMQARITLITFDSQSIDTIRDAVPAETCPELAKSEYEPRAWTPLLDAVGQGITMLDRRASTDERCILAVMTDGLENASREYTKETLKAALDRKQNENGWLVIYLGAGHDSWAQAGALGLHAGNVGNFAKRSLAASMDVMFARSARYVGAPSARRAAKSDGFTPAERASMEDGE